MVLAKHQPAIMPEQIFRRKDIAPIKTIGYAIKRIDPFDVGDDDFYHTYYFKVSLINFSQKFKTKVGQYSANYRELVAAIDKIHQEIFMKLERV